MKVLLSCLLITVIAIIIIGIISMLKKRERLSKVAFGSILLIFLIVELLCIIGLLFVLFFGYNS